MMNPTCRQGSKHGDSGIVGDQSLFDAMPCIVSIQDRGFRIIEANRRFEKEFGNRIGEHCFRVYKGRDSVCPSCSVEKTFQDGKVHHSEERVFKQGGLEATILVTTSPVFDSQNHVTAAVEMSLDITELRILRDRLRTSEERYRALFNHQPNPTLVVNLDDFSILDANDPALTECGYSREELLGSGFLSLVPETHRERVRIAVQQREKQVLKTQQLKRGGETISANISISYVMHEAKEAAVVTINDITDWLKAEQQLAQTSKLATLGEMSAGVAHELNQPLSVIKSASTFLSFLTKKVIDKAPQDSEEPFVVQIRTDILKPLADEITSHIDRATRLIELLREFGRKSDLTRQEVDINECIQVALMMLGRQLQARGISSHLDLAESLPPILADKNRIEQVFINLILNARDAIEQRQDDECQDHGEMSLSIRSDLEDDKVIVAFRDTGCGIKEDHLTKIFDPFFTTKEVGKGTGLGLSISYGIVQDYEGTFQVESQLNRGTRFTVSFPAFRGDRKRSNQ